MNYTILQQNILASLQHEEAKDAFLRAQELPLNDPSSYFAEAVARQADRLCNFLKPMIGAAALPFEANNDVKSDLLSFVLKRHWHLMVSR